MDCENAGSENIRGYRVFANPDDHDTDSAGLVAALRSKGVRDLYSMKSGDHAGQVALGFFRERNNADARVAALEKLGFSAQSEAVLGKSGLTDCRRTAQADDRSATPASPTPPVGAGAAEPGKTRAIPERGGKTEPADSATPPARASTAIAGGAPDCATDGGSYIVLADPAQNGNDTLALVYQLRAKGVENLFVVTTERHKGQIALGIYDDRQQAREREEELTAKGFSVRSERQSSSNCR